MPRVIIVAQACESESAGRRGDEPEFSAVVTCYREADTIEIFHRRLRAVLDGIGRSYEIVFVDDGSDDGTLDKLYALFDAHDRVGCVVELFKNSGQMAAIAAGIAHARGRHFLFIDSDLQLDPEDLPRLIERFDEGFDVVGGMRERRADSLFRVAPSLLMRVLLQRITQTRMRDFHCGFKLMHGVLVRACEYGPFKPFNPMGVIVRARRCTEVPVNHHERPHGRSGWSWRALFIHFMNHTAPFLLAPVRIASASAFLLTPLLLALMLLLMCLPAGRLPALPPTLLPALVALDLAVTLGLFWITPARGAGHFGALADHPAYIVRSVRRREAGRVEPH